MKLGTVLLCCLLPAALAAKLPADVQAKVKESKAFLGKLASQNLFGGSCVVHDGRNGFVLKEAYGYAFPELGVKLQPKHALPIGSDGKSFTAVGLWQLHQRGLLDVNAPVIKYMDKADFNQTTDWCPRLYNSTSLDCIYPTIKQLMMMGSGMVDVDNCRYKETDWQIKYCISEDKMTTMIGGSATDTITGKGSPAAYFAAEGYWDMPLESLPGTDYKYVNANFQLGAYIIEKVSGLPFGQYVRQHILEPAALFATAYDAAYGVAAVVEDYIITPAYRTLFSPVSEDYLKYIANATSLPLARYTSAPVGSYVGTARVYPVPGFIPWGNGAGGIGATPANYVRFWHTLLFQPEVLGLTQATVKEMLNSYNPVELSGGAYFAQALVVKPNPAFKPYGVELVFYQGGLPGIDSPMLLRFTNPDGGRVEDTVTVGFVSILTPELQVPLDEDNCTVVDWREGAGAEAQPVAIPEDLCMAAALGQSGWVKHVLTGLNGIWQGTAPADTGGSGLPSGRRRLLRGGGVVTGL